jgi:hypothetical protein
MMDDQRQVITLLFLQPFLAFFPFNESRNDIRHGYH